MACARWCHCTYNVNNNKIPRQVVVKLVPMAAQADSIVCFFCRAVLSRGHSPEQLPTASTLSARGGGKCVDGISPESKCIKGYDVQCMHLLSAVNLYNHPQGDLPRFVPSIMTNDYLAVAAQYFVLMSA